MKRCHGTVLTLMIAGLMAAGMAQIQTSEDLRQAIRSSISTAADGSNGKCGTAFRMAWRAERLPGHTGVEGVWDGRPVRQRSKLSPSGRFRVHYDTTGSHEPALLDGVGGRIPATAHHVADSALLIFDRTWNVIVTELGYDPPPADTAGGDAAYDVYLSDLPPDWFGEAVLEEPAPGPSPNVRWRTYLEIDNDFGGLRTPGMAGLRITAAHEFFHAIQVGAYGVWNDDDFYFYELTSVWMETVVEPAIEDYLFDLPSYFSGFSGRSFTTISSAYRGYERSVFAFFLEERFGREAVRETWNSIRGSRVLPSLDRMLEARGSGLRSAFREFALWNHRTRDRAAGAVTYRQAARYPRMNTAAAMTWSSPRISMASVAEPLSHATFDIRLAADTISAIVVNTDHVAAETGGTATLSISVRATASAPDDGGQRIGDLWLSISVPSRDEWSHEVVSAVRRDAIPPTDERPWPSPWVLSDDADLVLPVGRVGAPETVAFISTGNGVTTVERWHLESQRALPVARIPVGPMRGRLASGVYVVVLKRGNDQQVWKVAVVR